MYRLLVLVISLVLVFGVSNIVLAQEKPKLGYVDLSLAFDQYKKTIEYDKKLEQKGDKKQAEREKKVSEIKKLKSEQELLSDKGKEKQQAQIDAKIKELQDFDLGTRTDLKKERDDVVREILKEIDDVIQEYSKSEGYTLVINNRVMLYADESLDLTDKIIKILNSRYKR